jgi:hypothetical protein
LAILKKSDKVEPRGRKILPYTVGLPVSNYLWFAFRREVHAVN